MYRRCLTSRAALSYTLTRHRSTIFDFIGTGAPQHTGDGIDAFRRFYGDFIQFSGNSFEKHSSDCNQRSPGVHFIVPFVSQHRNFSFKTIGVDIEFSLVAALFVPVALFTIFPKCSLNEINDILCVHRTRQRHRTFEIYTIMRVRCHTADLSPVRTLPYSTTIIIIKYI